MPRRCNVVDREKLILKLPKTTAGTVASLLMPGDHPVPVSFSKVAGGGGTEFQLPDLSTVLSAGQDTAWVIKLTNLVN